MDREELIRRFEDELFKKVERESKSAERMKLEKTYKFDRLRYEAGRSVKGLYAHGPDPDEAPLDDPFDGAADVGSPIEMTVIQELVPNVMASHIGSIPFTETKKLGERGMEPYGVIDDFLYYELAHKSKIRPTRRKTILGAYKYGEMIEKVKLEKQTRWVNEERVLLTSGDKILVDHQNNEVEITGDPEDDKVLFSRMLEIVSGQDPRSLKYRYAIEVMKFDTPSAMEAAGIEVKNGKVRVAPLKPGAPGEPPTGDWERATTYKPEKVHTKEEITVGYSLDISNVDPIDFLVPSDAESNNLMDYWNCHRYRVPLEWLVERKGTGHNDGLIEERVDRLVEKFKQTFSAENKNQEGKSEPEIWETYERFVINKDSEKEAGYMREVEVIVWFSPDLSESPCLGWAMNPFARFPTKHIRPFFLFQVKPEDGKYHGLSVPETARGFRDMMDHLINGMMNRSALYSDPVTVMTPTCFELEENQKWGPGTRWIKEMNETIDVIRYYTPEQQNMEYFKFLNLGIRIMWGASEHLSGFSGRTESKTLGEAQLLATKGAVMYADTVESISQICDQQYEFIRCLYLYSGEVSDIEFPTATKQKEGAERQQTMKLTKDMLKGQIFIKSRRILTEADREVNIKALMAALDFTKGVSPNLIQSPAFIQPILIQFFDLLNLEQLKLPSVEELQQEQAHIQVMVQKMQEQERMQKALEGIKNKGARNQIEGFLRNAGMQGGAGPKAPGGPPNPAAEQGVGEVV